MPAAAGSGLRWLPRVRGPGTPGRCVPGAVNGLGVAAVPAGRLPGPCFGRPGPWGFEPPGAGVGSA